MEVETSRLVENIRKNKPKMAALVFRVEMRGQRNLEMCFSIIPYTAASVSDYSGSAVDQLSVGLCCVLLNRNICSFMKTCFCISPSSVFLDNSDFNATCHELMIFNGKHVYLLFVFAFIIGILFNPDYEYIDLEKCITNSNN